MLIDGNQYFATGVENLGGFATYTATYTGLAADAGDPITIQLGVSSGQGDFDNVRLSDNLYSAVPEPSTPALVGGGIIALFGFRKLRNKPHTLHFEVRGQGAHK